MKNNVVFSSSIINEFKTRLNLQCCDQGNADNDEDDGTEFYNGEQMNCAEPNIAAVLNVAVDYDDKSIKSFNDLT